MAKPAYSILNNSRFYILASALLISIATASLLRLQISSDQLYYIRTQQIFGLLCIFYWYIALAISPIGYLIGKQRIKHIEFARRGIGVSAAYFAVLHMLIALWGQLGGLGQIGFLPNLFKLSLLGGLVAVIILLIMASTSFDKVIKFMTFKKWKWLHRLVYFGGILAVLHIWTIGTHLSYSGVRVAAFVGLVVLSGLETFRVVTISTRKNPQLQTKAYFACIFASIWLVWIALILSLPSLVQNYHSEHHDDTHTSQEHEG